jgi:hypothetical protein
MRESCATTMNVTMEATETIVATSGLTHQYS